jgi:hypothetical protein
MTAVAADLKYASQSQDRRDRPLYSLHHHVLLTRHPQTQRRFQCNLVLSFIHNSSRLAATLGAKSALKKLQKRDILSVDVPKACTFLSDGSEPLALRLSSNLMYGVTRVFSQQYQFFYGNILQLNSCSRC